MKSVCFLAMVCLAAACGDPDDDDREVDHTSFADAGPADAAACSSSAPSPDGGYSYSGTTVYPLKCGQDSQCQAPICWLCTGGQWQVAGNEACMNRPDASADR